MALILVADDDELILEMIAEALRSGGHVVETLDDGSNVLEIVDSTRPALVVLDCAMPRMGGNEVVRKIRASTSCFDTPVLMLTGRRSEADEAIAFRAGATDYMRKPFDLAKLVDQVESMILDSECRPQAALL